MAGQKKNLRYSEETPWFHQYYNGWIGIGNCGQKTSNIYLGIYINKSSLIKLRHCPEVRFASFFSGGFITAIVVNLPERKLAKSTSVHCEKATKFEKISLWFWRLLSKSADLSKQEEDFFKFLWLFQKSWTLFTINPYNKFFLSWVQNFWKFPFFQII